MARETTLERYPDAEPDPSSSEVRPVYQPGKEVPPQYGRQGGLVPLRQRSAQTGQGLSLSIYVRQRTDVAEQVMRQSARSRAARLRGARSYASIG